jgi:hypothetical protein
VHSHLVSFADRPAKKEERRQMTISRRDFVQRLAASALAAALLPRVASGAGKLKHPDPRPGITSAKVLADNALPRDHSVRAAYAAARANPEVFDGLRCACGCSDEHRSLLTCYETKQPTGCWNCRDIAKLVSGQIEKKKTLPEIRAAVDKKYG